MATEKHDKEKSFPLKMENYRLILIGFAVILLGFILMIGGGNDNPEVFSEAVFSFRRITLAPILIVAGFAFVAWAIMKKPKENQNS